MTASLAHRGPDGSGIYIDGNVGLGHRRLAILDLSDAGSQPMTSNDGSLVIAYNGEVYNFKEIRLQLEHLGHSFRSETDTEVVLNAWREWGPASLSRFNGMFAFSLYDQREKCVYLARDRYGIKPLYWANTSSCVLFGSEQRAIKRHPQSPRGVDTAGLVEYFTFQNIISNRTFVDGIQIVPAGNYVRIDTRDFSAPVVTQYWDFNFTSGACNFSSDEYAVELDRLLVQAVDRQLVADVDVGAYLSGGMDSGAIVGIASQKISNLRTFTVGFDLASATGLEIGYDERFRAELMSAQFGTEQYEMVLKSGDMERSLGAVTRALEEPRVGQSYPNYYAAQLASKFGKVVLSGIGSDELFAGYPWRYHVASKSESFAEFTNHYFSKWQRLLPGIDPARAFAPIWDEVKDVNPRKIFSDTFRDRAGTIEGSTDYVNHCLYFDAKVFLHGLLVVEDKLSMTHSLESRVPFLDNDLVDFAMSCPVPLKLNDPFHLRNLNVNAMPKRENSPYNPRSDGKQILRNVMKKYLPDESSRYHKQGFSAPDASWFKGHSINFLKSKLLNPADPVYRFLDYNTIKPLLAEHLEGQANHRLLIWSLLTTSELFSCE